MFEPKHTKMLYLFKLGQYVIKCKGRIKKNVQHLGFNYSIGGPIKTGFARAFWGTRHMFINPRPHWFSLFGSCWFFFCLAHWYTWNCRPNQSHMDDLQWPSSPTYLKPSNCWVGLGGWPHHVFWKFKKLCSSPGQVLLWMLEMPRNCRPGVDNSEFLLVKDRSPNMADVIWKISDEKPGRFDAQWMKWIWGTPPEKIDGTTACCLQEYGLFFILSY